MAITRLSSSYSSFSPRSIRSPLAMMATGRGRRTWLVGFYGFVGASLLAKGLVGVVIPGMVVVVYYAFRRRWPGLFRLGLPWGTLLVLMVAVTWYGPVIARHGHAFIDEFFIPKSGAGFFAHRGGRLFVIERWLVGTLGSKCVVHIDDLQYARQQWDFAFLQTVGITGTVRMRVMVADDRQHKP